MNQPDPRPRRKPESTTGPQLGDLGGLAPFVESDTVVSAHVHGHNHVILEHRDGSVQTCHEPVAASDDALVEELASLFARHSTTDFPHTTPRAVLHMPLGGPLGCRITAVREPSHRPRVTIRRHHGPRATLGDLHEQGVLDPVVRELLAAAVPAGLTILVTGARHTGKTALLRALCHDIPHNEHVISVEEQPELGLNLTEDRLVIPMHTLDGTVSLDRLLEQARELRPSRLLLGEITGGEVTTALRVWGETTGGMATLNAPSVRVVPDRLAALGALGAPAWPAETTRTFLACTVDLIVHLETSSAAQSGTPQHQPYVSEIVEIVGYHDAGDMTTLFGPRAEQVRPPSATLRQRLAEHGFDADLLAPTHRGPGSKRGEFP